MANLQPVRPCVYLYQWVWIRLASVSVGQPQQPGDVDVLTQVNRAVDAGVAFPLSGTHYIETLRINDPRQRMDLANVMGQVSHFRTLRAPAALLREQLLTSMHDHFERPMFPPIRETPIGLGVRWAFTGKEERLLSASITQTAARLGMTVPPELLCRWEQFTELMALAGPDPADVDLLRAQYGYRPERTEEIIQNRLSFERELEATIERDAPSAEELRLWVEAREAAHEMLDLVAKTFREYGVSIRKLSGGGGLDPTRTRAYIRGFFMSMPSVRVAADAKTGTFRDRERRWQANDLHDVDAVRIAVPYCHVVVIDSASANALRRRHTGEATGTRITSSLSELVDMVDGLIQQASGLPDPSGWDRVAPGMGYAPMSPKGSGRSCEPPTADGAAFR